MATLLWVAATTVGGAIGWWLGSLVGGVMTALVVSMVGTALAAWWSRKFVRDHL